MGSDIYSPKNFNDKYAETDVSMAYALAVSDNIYAVKTHLYLGNKILYNTLKDFSFTSNINNKKRIITIREIIIKSYFFI